MNLTVFRLRIILIQLVLGALVTLRLHGQLSSQAEGNVTVPTGTIAFMTTRDGNYEVYSMDASGGQARNLTNHSAMDYWASFFPDGSKICFYSNRDGNNEIYIMGPDGTDPVNISNHPASDRMPNVSPDGKRIVFISNRDRWNDEIYMMDVDGSNVKRLTDNQDTDDVAFWSTDGRHIIFTREVKLQVDSLDDYQKVDGEIFTLNVDRGKEERLTNRPGYEGFPQYSPDGSKIVFHAITPDGDRDLFLMDTTGLQIINLTSDLAEDHSPSWSPDGQWIAYSSGTPQNYDIWIVHVATGGKKRLTYDPGRDEMPFWGTNNGH